MHSYTKITLTTYIKQLRKYWKTSSLAGISVVAGSAANLVAPLYYKKFFDIITIADTGNDKADALIAIITTILILHGISWVFWRIAVFCASYFETNGTRDLASSCFSYIHKHSASFFNNTFIGSLVKKVNRFAGGFMELSGMFLWDFLPLIVEFSFVFFVLFSRQALFGYIVLVWFVCFIVINSIFVRFKNKYDIKQAELDSKGTAILADTITNHENVKLFNGFNREVAYHHQAATALSDMRRFRWNLDQYFESVQHILVILVEFLVFYYGIRFWQQGLMTAGDFVLFQSYLLLLFNRIYSLGHIMRRLFETMANAKEMAEIYDTPHGIVDRKKATVLLPKKGEVTFDRVGFNYHKTRRILKDFSLTIKGGQKIGLVGKSGAGKSTVVRLLLRTFDTTRGSITIDGQKLSHVTLESLHDTMSFVPQDPILFHRTLKENIRYGKPGATDKEVIEAAESAHCHEFITNLEEKYDTLVGERGVKLSGGERQRIAIARAILRNTPILILDEATSALDSESELLIQDALHTLMKGKTVIAIAHRLSTVMHMDRIIVMEEGEIIEDGSHKKLLRKKKGMYKKLWELQAGGFVE
jgi:ATP-binding cassette, subfamily B, bacterial